MEGFKFGGNKENFKTLELKKLVDAASKRMGLALKVLLISGLSLLASNKTLAQNVESSKSTTNENSNSKIEWVSNLEEEEKKDIEQTILLQKEWLKDYIQSNKFTERATKEEMMMEEIGVYGKDEGDYQNFLNNPKFNIFEINQQGDTSIIINHIRQNIDFKGNRANEITSEEFEKIIQQGEFLGNFLPNIDISKASPNIKLKVKYIKQSRLDRLGDGKTVVVDSIGKKEDNTVGIFYHYGMKIEIRKDFKQVGGETTPGHEEAHKSTMGNNGLNSTTYNFFKNRAVGHSEYLKDPTEIHARMNELRFLLKEEGIYDASTEDFTRDHFVKVLANKRIMRNFAIIQLLETLQYKDLIWFMNNVAGDNIVTIDISNTA